MEKNRNNSKSNQNLQKFQLFIGGISIDIKREELENYFSKFGKINNIEIPIDKKTGRGKGFAHIYFENKNSIDNILKKEHIFDNKTIQVEKGLSKQEQKKKLKNYSKYKIYVAKLPKNLTEEEFTEYFRTFGKVKRAYIVFDNITRKSRGFGYVEFFNKESASKALSYENHDLNGIKIIVNEMKLKKEQNKKSNNKKEKISKTWNSLGTNSRGFSSISPDKDCNLSNYLIQEKERFIKAKPKMESWNFQSGNIPLLEHINPINSLPPHNIYPQNTQPHSLSPKHNFNQYSYFNKLSNNLNIESSLHNEYQDDFDKFRKTPIPELGIFPIPQFELPNEVDFSLNPQVVQQNTSEDEIFKNDSKESFHRFQHPSISEDLYKNAEESNQTNLINEEIRRNGNITSIGELPDFDGSNNLKSNHRSPQELPSIEFEMKNISNIPCRPISPFKSSTINDFRGNPIPPANFSPVRTGSPILTKRQEEIFKKGLFWKDDLNRIKNRKFKSSHDFKFSNSPSRYKDLESIFRKEEEDKNYRINLSFKSLTKKSGSHNTCDTLTFMNTERRLKKPFRKFNF